MSFETHDGSSAPRDPPVVDLHGEDEVATAARSRSRELNRPAVGPRTAAMLRFLTSALLARTVVEIGTGAGVSGLHLLRGMTAGGVLTSIDIEPEGQRLARRSFTEAGFTSGRTRLITGRALDVLPRFTAGGYDLVFIDAAHTEYPQYYEQAVPLLRPGGVLALHDALGTEDQPDGGDRHPAGGEAADTRTARALTHSIRRDERLAPVLLPLETALLVAAVTGKG